MYIIWGQMSHRMFLARVHCRIIVILVIYRCIAYSKLLRHTNMHYYRIYTLQVYFLCKDFCICAGRNRVVLIEANNGRTRTGKSYGTRRGVAREIYTMASVSFIIRILQYIQ